MGTEPRISITAKRTIKQVIVSFIEKASSIRDYFINSAKI
jgi:hypothetical protein